MLAAQFHDDNLGTPRFVERSKISCVYSNEDGRTVVTVDAGWAFFASETLAEALAIWQGPVRGNPNAPAISVKDVDQAFLASCKARIAKQMP